MSSKSTQLAERIRERLCERALSGSPQWLAPILPGARETAGALLIGNLTGRLPVEDASALIRTILHEQNADGSWSAQRGEPGNLSVTLEAVQALSTITEESVRSALSRAVNWLEQNRSRQTLDEETIILLGALAEMTPNRLRRLSFSLQRWLSTERTTHRPYCRRCPSLKLALSALSLDKLSARRYERLLLQRQLPDGSWDGSARATVFVLIALRHAALPTTDTAFERGWRFLRSLQLWNHQDLVQNPCDISVLLHATAVHSLLTSGVEAEAVTGSVLTLVHQADPECRWSAGASFPPDNFTTAWALDALSMAGDTPVETMWTRRRAALRFMHTQRNDGGWRFDIHEKPTLTSLIAARGLPAQSSSSVEVTAAVLQALIYAGVPDLGQDHTVLQAVRFLLKRQSAGGLWPSDLLNSEIFSTATVMDALSAVGSIECHAAVRHGLKALLKRQRVEGGWNDAIHPLSSIHHTAWVLRALSAIPETPTESLARARLYLERSVDLSELMWSRAASALPLPVGFGPLVIPELTSLWALEALVPVGIPYHPRARQRWHSRSLFDRSR